MIPKGLKVGDTFDDNGIYKVLKVVGENYESIWVGESSPNALVVEQPKLQESMEKVSKKGEEITEDDVNSDYLSMPYAQLKKLCAERGLDATGKKSDLIARLEG